MFHGFILRVYDGNSFDEKFKNYLYYSGIQKIPWISSTDYDKYYNTLANIISKHSSYRILLKLIYDYRKKKLQSVTQGFTKILGVEGFFKDMPTVDDTIIDEHVEIFRELGAIAEHHLKLLYAIKSNYSSQKDIDGLETTNFYDIWKVLKNDVDYSVFTKPFPNTIYWNASKHSGITKKVRSKEIEFKSSNGSDILPYPNFVSLVRELYACVIVLIKIGLIIRFRYKIYITMKM
jgi:hypothetical protein